jgi:hypothetical protein
LYLWAKVLAESHVLEIQGRLVGDGCADPLRSGGGGGHRAGKRVRHHVSCTWYLSWLVYSEIKARWRCWRPEVGGETL